MAQNGSFTCVIATVAMKITLKTATWRKFRHGCIYAHFLEFDTSKLAAKRLILEARFRTFTKITNNCMDYLFAVDKIDLVCGCILSEVRIISFL